LTVWIVNRAAITVNVVETDTIELFLEPDLDFEPIDNRRSQLK